ncbi:hypothetical protein JHW43_000995 [Diplocarpon mali]|nr:hypothetical protein JHW43_000995 [Diplocarpon mali]
MPSSAVASYSNSKGANMFAQSYEEFGADFFDQFLAYSPEYSETPGYSPVLGNTLEQSTDCQSAGASLSSTDDETTHAIADDTWQGGLRAAEDHDGALLPSAAGDHFYELSGRAAISDSELLTLEGIFLESPRIPAASRRSLPSSPTVGPAHQSLRRKNRMVESLSKTFNKASGSLDESLRRSPIRKQKSAPKMMGTAHQRTSHSNLDLWGQKLDLDDARFQYDFKQDDPPLSPPASARVPDVARVSSSLDPQEGELLGGLTYKTALTQQQHMVRSTAYDTPLSTPTLAHPPSRRTGQQGRSESVLFPITPQAQNASGSWSQMPGSPEFTSYRASSACPEIGSPIWWNHAATAPMAQPSPNRFHNPQRASKFLAMQLQNDVAYHSNDMGLSTSSLASGLMIQMPDTSAQQSSVMGTPPAHPRGYVHSPRSQPPPHHSRHRSDSTQYNTHSSREPSRHARPRYPRHPSPVIRASHCASRGSESPSPPPPAFHVRKRKSKPGKQATPRTPPPPPPATGAVSFVNYTPSDSRKILTGVAPSGSSKTKARREKEALDKRRKLSQAAVRAVRAAGGDIDSLVEQGLFV